MGFGEKAGALRARLWKALSNFAKSHEELAASRKDVKAVLRAIETWRIIDVVTLRKAEAELDGRRHLGRKTSAIKDVLNTLEQLGAREEKGK